MSANSQNWAGNYTYRATGIHEPKTLDELQRIVCSAQSIRALGSRHSFNSIADCEGDLVSMGAFDRLLSIDRSRMTVTVEGGITYGALSKILHREGLALHNLASLPHISVVGACATATHGSGDANGNLATVVEAMKLVTGDGSLREVSGASNSDELSAVAVGLGGFGIVTAVTLRVEPAFEVAQSVYERLPVAELEANFDAITSAAYSVSLFTDWRDDTVNQVWLKHRVSPGVPPPDFPTFYGATRQSVKLHPLAGVSPENCTEQLGVPGPWFERLPHFRMEFTPSNGDELQSEYLVPRPYAIAAMRAVRTLADELEPHLYISEVRTIAADELWLSPCYRQACVGIHFTWRPHVADVNRLMPKVEGLLQPFDARPHWGKLFTMAPERVRSLYPRLGEYARLRHTFDPERKFVNEFLDRYVLEG
ncbi:MAG TPA: D-arabinono-1,4-lactone oxidase [Fimbriimonadaceae bacterium]|nr:D-arabinono-1,4-lactone oxidase [Fimbriimonadaceae bacterium]